MEIEKTINYMRDTAKELAEATAQYEYLKEFRKVKKATLMQVAERDGFKTTAAQEREAYANEEYNELLSGLKIALERKTYLKWMMTTAQHKIEAWRSIEATNRQEYKNYGN